MKYWMRLFLSAFVLFAFCLSDVAEAAEVIKLKFADSYPVGHLGYRSNLHFKKRLEEITKGKVVVEYFPSEQLGKLKDLLRICGSGITDIAYVPPSFYSGQLPLSTVMILPFWTTATDGSKIYQRLVFESPELMSEFKKYGVRPILGNATCQYDIGTVKKPVKNVEDVKGLRLRTSGGLFDKIAIRYGIVPVSIASPEVYEATQRGIVDGVIFSFASVKGYRVDDLEKYHTYGLRMGGYPAAYVINEKKWQKLPKDVQDAVLQAGKDASRYYGENWDKEQEELAVSFAKGGMTITKISGKELAVWMKPMNGIEEEWIRDMEKKGLPGRAVFERFKKLCNEIAK
jgi:TRAP-type C4-dicarboxylate transport system substrate-binding protein